MGVHLSHLTFISCTCSPALFIQLSLEFANTCPVGGAPISCDTGRLSKPQINRKQDVDLLVWLRFYRSPKAGRYYSRRSGMAEGSAESPCCEVAPKDVDSNVPEPEAAQVEGQLQQRSYRHEAGGYGCQFVSRPPEELQLECAVCLQILRNPHLIDCCGHNFCQSCINCVQMEGKPCPLCNEPSFRVMHNKGLQRTLNGFTVYCTHRQDGCSWVGELRALISTSISNLLWKNSLLGVNLFK